MPVRAIRRLPGHKSSLLCCNCSLSDPNLIATSAQDGRVCLFDIRNKDHVQMFDFFGQNDVSSICFVPGSAHTLYTAAGMSIYYIDTRLGSSLEALQKYTFNGDEINQITLNQKGSLLAAADDSGEIKVIDLNGHKLLKTLRNVHTNICSTVQFHPQRPWELISGGLDAKIVKWDISKGKPLKTIDQGTVSSQISCAQLCNPPFVHSLAIPEGKVSGDAGKVIAVARGDGVVEFCDLMLEKWRPGVNQPKSLPPNKKSFINNPAQSIELDNDLDGHKSAVSCVTFARFSQSKTLVISGSNDRSVKLWDLHCKNGEIMLLTEDHKRKVNWICTSSRDSENLFVADTSKKLSVYTVS